MFGGPTGYNPTAFDQETQIRIVKDLVPHPLAKQGLHLTSYDVILVELHEPLSLNKLVNAICLAEEDIKPGQLCITAGWTSAKQGEEIFP